MALGNYMELIEAVVDEIARPDLHQVVKDKIRLAEMRIQQDLELNALETSITGTFTASQDYLTLPSGLVELIELRVDVTSGGGPVGIVPHHKLRDIRENDISGIPKAGAIIGKTIELADTPASAHAYTLWYLDGIPALADTASSRTNTLLSEYGNMLFYASCLECQPYVGDEARVGLWQTFYTDRLRAVKRKEWRKKATRKPLQMRPDTFA